MARFLCDDEDVAAPRPGCGCRECSLVRERAIDPRLVEMARAGRDPRSGMRVLVPVSANLIMLALREYTAGRIEWASLHITIIEAMAKELDQLVDEKLAVAMRSPSRLLMGQYHPGDEA